MRTWTNISLVTMVFYGIFVLSVHPVIADDSNTDIAYTQQLSNGFHFMIDMLKILSITLNQTSSLISENQDQYPFLKEMIGDSTNQSVKSVNEMINVSNTNISNATSVKEALAEIHDNLESPADMINSANETLGDPENTTPVIQDMYNTVSNMTNNVTYGG